MPQLSESTLVETVKTKFRSFNVALPSVVSSTPANVGQFLVQNRQGTATGFVAPQRGAINVAGSPTGGFKIGVGVPAPPPRPTAVPQNVPPALVRSASSDKADVDFQTQVNTELTNYINAICHAIVGAHDNWRYTAFLRGVTIMGPLAMGGSISGPLLSENMNMYGPQQGLWGNAAAYTRAISDGLASCWREWEHSVSVPNLPWYPTFAIFAGTQAPPVPNTPSPFNKLTWSPLLLTVDNLKMVMSRKLSLPGPYSDELITSIAAGFNTVVGMWFSTQMVTNVLGMGPVPSFAPPYVPVGPVSGGKIVEASPHFAA